jgi:hypothetical protein
MRKHTPRPATLAAAARYAKRYSAVLALLLCVAVALVPAQKNKGIKGVKVTPRVVKAGGSKHSPLSIQSANFVYHEQTNNFVATPTCSPAGGTDTSCGRFVENTDRSGSAGFQIFSPETYTLHFKIEFQFFTNQVRVYYTTDGTQPCGSFGVVGNVTQPNNTPCGASNTTQVSVASYTCTYSDQTQSCQVVEVATGTIPPQLAGTTVRYIVSAWHSGGGSEVFGNSGTCGGCFSATNSSDATNFQYNVIAPPATPLIISEFRLRGTNGASDEFAEIYNNSDSDVTINAFDGSAGFSLAASDGIARFTIPNGTVIPARGHYLGVNSVAYSLASYPAGNGTTATGDATYTTGIADNAGIALFNTSNPANFTLANRLDAVGSTSEANTLYKEGTGYPPLNAATSTNQNSFYRDMATTGTPKDTGNNSTDFLYVSTDGLDAGAGARLGAPGPENLSSPINRGATIKPSLLDRTVASSNPPNRVRVSTSDPANNSSFGTLDIRRRFTNNTGSNVTRLRFRIVDITTFPNGSAITGVADVRARTSTALSVSGINDTATCPGGIVPCTVTVQGTTLEEPPTQSSGGGYNSSLSADSVALASPLAPGASINVRFLLGVQTTGNFRFFVIIEALP